MNVESYVQREHRGKRSTKYRQQKSATYTGAGAGSAERIENVKMRAEIVRVVSMGHEMGSSYFLQCSVVGSYIYSIDKW